MTLIKDLPAKVNKMIVCWENWSLKIHKFMAKNKETKIHLSKLQAATKECQ